MRACLAADGGLPLPSVLAACAAHSRCAGTLNAPDPAARRRRRLLASATLVRSPPNSPAHLLPTGPPALPRFKPPRSTAHSTASAADAAAAHEAGARGGHLAAPRHGSLAPRPAHLTKCDQSTGAGRGKASGRRAPAQCWVVSRIPTPDRRVRHALLTLPTLFHPRFLLYPVPPCPLAAAQPVSRQFLVDLKGRKNSPQSPPPCARSQKK